MPMSLAQYNIIDYRRELARATWSIGTRTRTTSFTVHYNGPAVPAFGNPNGELSQLQFDARYHMRPGVIAVNGADGIQYHGATLSNGQHYQLRDWSSLLWHCGNAEGNTRGLAWHLPLGGNQQPTQKQYDALRRIIDYVVSSDSYFIDHVNVHGHSEWSNTLCPGPWLMQFIREYRAAHTVSRPLQWYKTLFNVNVRSRPDVASNILTTLPVNTTFAGRVISGAAYNGNALYVARGDGQGYVHTSVVKEVLA